MSDDKKAPKIEIPVRDPETVTMYMIDGLQTRKVQDYYPADEHTKREKATGKSYGPRIVASFLNDCIYSYIEYGITRDEVVELVGVMYDEVLEDCEAGGIGLGFGIEDTK